MLRPPFALKPERVVVDPKGDGLRVDFSGETPDLRVDLESSLQSAFAGHAIRVWRTGTRRHAAQIRGLTSSSILRVRNVFRVLHLFHDDPAAPDVALALGWQTHPGGERTPVGQIEYDAKWRNNAESHQAILEQMLTIVRAHDSLRSATAIAAPPSSKPLARSLARGIGNEVGIPTVQVRRAGSISKQSDEGNTTTFEALLERQRGALAVSARSISGDILIVDDLYGSGGTIREMTRLARQSGAARVFALTATKSRRYHRKT